MIMKEILISINGYEISECTKYCHNYEIISQSKNQKLQLCGKEHFIIKRVYTSFFPTQMLSIDLCLFKIKVVIEPRHFLYQSKIWQ